MSRQLLISHTTVQTRLVLLEHNLPHVIYFDNHHHPNILGDVYLGVVVRVLPQMQMAFVDIGRARTAVLSARDLGLPQSAKSNLIEYHLKAGMQLMVQVIKDELGDKGARLTTKIKLVMPLLVYIPDATDKVVLSAKLQHAPIDCIKQLKHQLGLHGTIIVRTQSQDADETTLRHTLAYFLDSWQTINHKRQQAVLSKQKSALLYHTDRVFDVLQEQMIDEIWVDDDKLCQAIQTYVQRYLPANIPQISYQQPAKLTHLNLNQMVTETLSPRVHLPSGGYLVIYETEAMVTIDVNSGSMVGKNSAYQTNIEAVSVISHQMILRQLSGVIIVDFIDMTQTTQQQAFLTHLERHLRLDKHITSIQSKPNELVIIHRKRSVSSLTKQLCTTCTTCQGTGFIKSMELVAFEIVNQLLSIINQADVINIYVNPELGDYLQQSQCVDKLQNLTTSTLVIDIDNAYLPAQYRIIQSN